MDLQPFPPQPAAVVGLPAPGAGSEGWPRARTSSTSCRQRHGSRSDLAAVHVLRGEPTPAPLVLPLVEPALAVAAITVELPYGGDVVDRVGGQHGVLPQRLANAAYQRAAHPRLVGLRQHCRQGPAHRSSLTMPRRPSALAAATATPRTPEMCA